MLCQNEAKPFTGDSMELTICQTGHPVLRQAAQPLSADEIRSDETQQLIARMQATMRAAPGVGLAAPQIGLAKQIAVIEDRPEYIARWEPAQITKFQRQPVPFYVLINPVVEILDERDTVLFFEGCLSVAGFGALVPRARRVRVSYLDAQAEPQTLAAEGWHARIIQHEVDHLGGRLYLDRMLTRSFAGQEQISTYWADKSVSTICQELAIPAGVEPE